MPVVGFLISATRDGYARVISEIQAGLVEAGLVDGKNMRVEYRYADEDYDRLPALAGYLVQKRVAVIISTGSVVSPLAAKAATSTIPIVFSMGSDPVRYGMVA